MRERRPSACYDPQVIAAIAIAAGTGIIVMGYHWLEMAGLPAVDWGTFAWPLMAFLWAPGFPTRTGATRED